MEPVIPKMILIESTSACNLKCKLCPTTTGQASVGHMKPDLFYSIVDRIQSDPGLQGVTVVPWVNGEPLCNPDFPDFVEYIDSRALRSYITTNGTIWNGKLFDRLTDPGCSVYQLIFSLDGLWDEYSKSIEIARPGSNRVEIRRNIERFIYLKHRKHSPIDICLKICRRGQDWEEIENFIAYWLRNDADFVCVGEALDKINPESMRIYPCQYSDNSFMVIKWDGRVVRCAYNDEAVNNPIHTLAQVNLDSTPLLDIYNNDRLTLFRSSQRRGVFPGPCSTCGFAYTGMGMEGTIRFRNKRLQSYFHDRPIFTHSDYYNTFYSLKKRLRPDDYYEHPEW